MQRTRTQRKPWIYLRLSREDLSDAAEPVDVKLEKRKLIALGLAAQYNLSVPEENILIEVVSGKTIEQREQFKQLLEHCRVGNVSALIVPYFDRLTRGSKKDEAELEESLKDGEVVVISTEGIFDFGDPNFDAAQGLAFTVRNAVSRQYIFDMSKKLRETNLVRTKQGQRSAGMAPYGYEWIKPVYRTKRLVEPGRYEVVPEEYTVVCEICERIWTEGARHIAEDLNRRFRTLGFPTPPSANNRMGWHHSSLLMLFRNPHYAGFPAHRFVNRRGGRRTLDRSDWVFPEERQDFPCPFTLEEWERLQLHLASRKLTGSPKTNKQAILTGILFCSNGRHMTNRGYFYACTCREYATPHKGMAVYEPKVNQIGYELVRQTVLALPEDLLSRSEATVEPASAYLNYRLAVGKLQEARQLRDDLMLHATTHLKIYGKEAYEEVCRTNKLQIDQLEAHVTALYTAVQAPDMTRLMPLLKSVRSLGFDAFWEAATVAERRAMITAIISRLTMVEPTVRYFEHIEVEPHRWVSEFITLPSTLSFPRKLHRR